MNTFRFWTGFAFFLTLGLGIEWPMEGSQADPKPGKTPELFRLSAELERNPTRENWDRLLDLVAAIKTQVDTKAKRSPYNDLKAMVNIDSHRKLPEAKPGLHSLWHTARHVSKIPPGPGGSYINTAVAIMPTSLTKLVPKNVVERAKDDRGEYWDGYISKSIVVVDGTILTTSYIYDSIVIAAGPIRTEGYINNSLVISVGSRGPSVVDVSQGYLATCLVVGERVQAGYVQDSMVFGKLDSESLRGADVRDHEEVVRIPWINPSTPGK